MSFPASLAPPYGDYDVKVETVATDGSVSDCPTIISYAKDAWAFEAGAIPFLDGRRQIKENAEFQLRAAQGCAVWGPGDTNQVPFEVEQLRTTGGSSYDFSETAQVDYVTPAFTISGLITEIDPACPAPRWCSTPSAPSSRTISMPTSSRRAPRG